jgi:hypothetical protein
VGNDRQARRLIIRDGTEAGGSGGLDFGLCDILHAIDQKGRTLSWRGRDIGYISKDERDVAVIQALGGGGVVSGSALFDGIDQLLQVIDGEFEGTEPGSAAPLVIIRAIDSSWWEVLSDDETVLAAIRRRFRAVEEASTEPPAS